MKDTRLDSSFDLQSLDAAGKKENGGQSERTENACNHEYRRVSHGAHHAARVPVVQNARHRRRRSSEAGDGGHRAAGKEVARQRLQVVDPDLEAEEHDPHPGDGHVRALSPHGEDSRGDEQRAGRHHRLARPVRAPTARDEVSRGPAAGQGPQAGGDEGEPGRPADLREAEAARFLEVARHPEDVQPPDGIGQEPADDDGPHLAIAEELEPAGMPRLTARAVRRGGFALSFEDGGALLLPQPGMLLREAIDEEPEHEPAKTETARDDEGGPPAPVGGQQGDEGRRQRASDRGSGVEDAHAQGAFLRWKPLGDRLGRPRPVAGLAESENEAPEGEARHAARGGVGDRGDRPHDDRDRESDAGPDRVVQPAGEHLAGRVGDEEGVLDGRVFGVREPEVVADGFLEDGHRLAVDVVDDGGEEDESDHPPAEARHLPHRISIPPLISTVSPARYAESRPHRKAITRPTSSGVPARPSGTVLSAASKDSRGVKRSWKLVWPIRPGATQFTRTPRGASSFAMALVSEMRPPLAAA